MKDEVERDADEDFEEKAESPNQMIKSEKTMLPAKIPQEVFESVVAMTDEDTQWIKFDESGFSDKGEFISKVLSGRIVGIHPYLVKWTKGQNKPEKIPYPKDGDAPVGFENRIDLKILLRDKEVVGVSLPPTSSKSFSRYVRRLQDLKVDITEVVTVLKPRAIVNADGQRFGIIDFEIAPRRRNWEKNEEAEEADISF